MISVCICTFNRSDQLKLTLDSLVLNADTFEKGDEVLIVDNNSTDNTRSVVDSYLELLPIVYVFQPLQGLANARNAGLARYKNGLIIFIDDDISITKYFINAYRVAIEKFPNDSFFGGKILVDWNNRKPKWLKTNDVPLINGLIGHYEPTLEGAVTDGGNYTTTSLLPYGANFALRRNMQKDIGLFDPRFGVNGDQIGRGEETEYFLRVLKNGYNGRYLETALNLHRFQADRINIQYLYEYGKQKGVAAVNLNGIKSENSVSKALYQLFSGLYQLLKLRKDRFYQCVINIGLIRGIHIASKHETN